MRAPAQARAPRNLRAGRRGAGLGQPRRAPRARDGWAAPARFRQMFPDRIIYNYSALSPPRRQ